MLRFAFEFHALLVREGQIGPVPGAALALTVTALAVVLRHRFGGDFITDRATGASAGVSFAHLFSPAVKVSWTTDTSRASSVFAHPASLSIASRCVIRARLLARSETTLPRWRRPRWLARRARRPVRDVRRRWVPPRHPSRGRP